MNLQFLFYGFNHRGDKKIALCQSRAQAEETLQKLSALPILKIQRKAIYVCSPFKKFELIAFTAQLSTLIQAGLPLNEALLLLKKEEKKPHWEALLEQLIAKLTEGNEFSAILAHYPAVFPPIYREIIAVSELTGDLATSLQQLAERFNAQEALKKKVKKAIRYPLFLFSMTLLAAVLLLLFVLPQFSNLYANFNAPLPKITALFIALSDFLSQHFFILFLSTFFLIVSILWIKKKYPLIFEALLFRCPLISHVFKTGLLAQFFQTLALMQQHQVEISKALHIALKALPSLQFQNHLFALRQQIEQGLSFSEAIKKNAFFPPFCAQLITIGEETGQLTPQLQQIATYYQAQNAQHRENLSKSLEPFLMSFMALFIGSLIVAVYLPIFSLGDIF